jgi:hypothetical protein
MKLASRVGLSAHSDTYRQHGAGAPPGGPARQPPVTRRGSRRSRGARHDPEDRPPAPLYML